MIDRAFAETAKMVDDILNRCVLIAFLHKQFHCRFQDQIYGFLRIFVAGQCSVYLPIRFYIPLVCFIIDHFGLICKPFIPASNESKSCLHDLDDCRESEIPRSLLRGISLKQMPDIGNPFGSFNDLFSLRFHIIF